VGERDKNGICEEILRLEKCYRGLRKKSMAKKVLLDVKVYPYIVILHPYIVILHPYIVILHMDTL